MGENQLADQNFYEILEIPINASQEEIHKAFHRAKQTYSPNSPALYSVFSKEEAEELLRLIDEAYLVLSNQAKRKSYDQTLFNKKGITPPAVTLQALDGIHETTNTSSGAHGDELPDFAIPEAQSTSWTEESAAVVSDRANATPATSATVAYTPSPELSGKIGRTRFSHYEIDAIIESEIESQTVFDGTFIQKVRQYKRVSLDQISEHSRIGRHYLVSIEANDFNSLPARVFVRGFVSQYARVLGLDETKVVNSFMKLYKDIREK